MAVVSAAQAATYGILLGAAGIYLSKRVGLWKDGYHPKKKPLLAAVLAAANVITALLFAAGHLPATYLLLGLSPLIVFRCFLLNGGIGLLIGYLYRKHGLGYAMIAHGGCHVVSKLIWIFFV